MNSLLHSLLFYLFATIVLGSAAFTAFSRNLVHAAFSLLFTFFGIACMYLYLGADFVGISQIIVYVGGILVLLLFGVMFTSQTVGIRVRQTLQNSWGMVFFLLLLCLLLPVIYVTPWPELADLESKAFVSTVSAVGRAFLTEYLLPFEVASLLLLIALIGAVVIARGEPKAQEALSATEEGEERK